MIPYFEWHTFFLGPIPLQVWGFWVALGIVVASVIATKRLRAFGIQKEPVLDLFVWVLVAAFLGARVFHIVFYEPQFFLANPFEIFKIWHGGLSSYGGFVGAALGFWLFYKKKGSGWLKKVSLIKFFDELSLAALWGWMIGRIGCFMIHDHWGAPCDCLLAVNKPEGARLDMALLEILSLLPLGIFLVLWRNKKKPDGFVSAVVLVYYGVVRFLLDFWRATDIIQA
ncbi:MAG: prolipoprotein diacylglyceryl transferase, partial [Candidatus Magasanikbacteria bacterium]|nr:prolipoprotein diacylglyceryl transferase [Candidatus Magasanikbacteria bacterium]